MAARKKRGKKKTSARKGRKKTGRRKTSARKKKKTSRRGKVSASLRVADAIHRGRKSKSKKSRCKPCSSALSKLTIPALMKRRKEIDAAIQHRAGVTRGGRKRPFIGPIQQRTIHDNVRILHVRSAPQPFIGPIQQHEFIGPIQRKPRRRVVA